MAGIWDRIIPGEDRIPVHALIAAITLAAEGVFTDAQIRDGLNSLIKTPLSTAAQTDLTAIRGQISLTSLGSGVRYLRRFDSLCIAVEIGLLTSEVTFRTRLGI